MDTLQCAIVLAKLERFDWELQQRLNQRAFYNELLGGQIGRIRQRPDRTTAYAQYTVLVENRTAVQLFLKEMNIPTAVHYPVPIPLQPAYEQFLPAARFPEATEMAGKVMSLPMGAYLDIDSLKRVANAVLLSAACQPVT
jgi:UDP-2-acetamido-2-deoxy-ribo-hexuluronate aminotransferase